EIGAVERDLDLVLGFDFCDALLDLGGIGQSMEHDVAALCRQCPRRGSADARSRSGHQCALACNLHKLLQGLRRHDALLLVVDLKNGVGRPPADNPAGIYDCRWRNSPHLGCHTSSRRSTTVTTWSRQKAKTVRVRMPAKMASISKTPSACRMR